MGQVWQATGTKLTGTKSRGLRGISCWAERARRL